MSQLEVKEKFENRALQLQIDLLHKSNEITDNAVGRLDEIISKLRNWAVVIWTGSIALAIQSDEHALIPLTACIPLLFWFANAFYSQHLLACSYRQKKVAEKFNATSRVADIFKQQDFGIFNVFDPLSVMDKDDPDYQKEVNFKRALILKDSKILYPSLAIISIIVWGIFK